MWFQSIKSNVKFLIADKRMDTWLLMRKNILAIAILVAFIGGLSYFSASYLWRIRLRQEALIFWRLSDALVLLTVIIFLYGLNAKTPKKRGTS